MGHGEPRHLGGPPIFGQIHVFLGLGNEPSKPSTDPSGSDPIIEQINMSFCPRIQRSLQGICWLNGLSMFEFCFFVTIQSISEFVWETYYLQNPSFGCWNVWFSFNPSEGICGLSASLFDIPMRRHIPMMSAEYPHSGCYQLPSHPLWVGYIPTIPPALNSRGELQSLLNMKYFRISPMKISHENLWSSLIIFDHLGWWFPWFLPMSLDGCFPGKSSPDISMGFDHRDHGGGFRCNSLP